MPAASTKPRRSGKRRSRTDAWINHQDNHFHVNNQDLWTDLYAPTNEFELAVHKDKLRQLTNCLETTVSSTSPPSTLLLTGPPGCGKLTALKLLLASLKQRQHQIDLQTVEWTGPDKVTTAESSSNSDSLDEFLARVGRYRPTSTTGTSSPIDLSIRPSIKTFTVIIVKNPHLDLLTSSSYSSNNNAGKINQTDLLTRLIRLHQTKSQPNSLLVLLLTSSGRQSVGDMDHLTSFASIAFNPTPVTLAVKALHRISSLACSQRQGIAQPSRSLILQLANECSGDLRHAVNQLQFLSLSSPTATALTSSSNQSVVDQRDHSLPLFRAIGKLLYAKREPPSDCQFDQQLGQLPDHLTHWRRDPLTFDLYQVYDQAELTDPDQWLAWLHANALDFVPELDLLDWLTNCYSWADAFLSGSWQWRLGLTSNSHRHLPSLTAIQATVLATTGPITTSRQFRPLRPPNHRVSRNDPTVDAKLAFNQTLFSTSCQPQSPHCVSGRDLLLDVTPLVDKLAGQGHCAASVYNRFIQTRLHKQTSSILTLSLQKSTTTTSFQPTSYSYDSATSADTWFCSPADIEQSNKFADIDEDSS